MGGGIMGGSNKNNKNDKFPLTQVPSSSVSSFSQVPNSSNSNYSTPAPVISSIFSKVPIKSQVSVLFFFFFVRLIFLNISE